MSLLYNDAELIELMQDFYSISGIRIVLFDANFEAKTRSFSQNAVRVTGVLLKNAGRQISFTYQNATQGLLRRACR